MSEPKITLIIPNRDRMSSVENSLTQYQMKSLANQTCKNFKFTVIDGGSKNIDELKQYFSSLKFPNIDLLEHNLVGKFHKSLLNNIAIRKATTPYIMTSDADIFFAPKFFETLIPLLSEEKFIESRTMYWYPSMMQEMYAGRKNPFDDIETCKLGRIKKRTTPGGCQCAHKNLWEKVRGYDERYIGWGSEDVDLWRRMCMANNCKAIWLGESIESIMLFHQHHDKIDHAEEMKDQYKNLNYYYNIKSYDANPDGWGGMK